MKKSNVSQNEHRRHIQKIKRRRRKKNTVKSTCRVNRRLLAEFGVQFGVPQRNCQQSPSETALRLQQPQHINNNSENLLHFLLSLSPRVLSAVRRCVLCLCIRRVCFCVSFVYRAYVCEGKRTISGVNCGAIFIAIAPGASASAAKVRTRDRNVCRSCQKRPRTMQQPRYSPAPPPPVTIRPQMAPRHQAVPNPLPMFLTMASKPFLLSAWYFTMRIEPSGSCTVYSPFTTSPSRTSHWLL
uniref:Uncharacterized protein n=1 Tax=Anopheles farauti TaxID=69004 RepID=A0A182QLI1_9DIPT